MCKHRRCAIRAQETSPTRTDARISGEVRRLDDLRAVEVRRLDEIRRIERGADHKLAKVNVRRLEAMQIAEGRRVDALLADAKAAVALSNTRAEMTATTLAEKVADSAIALADKVEATAAAAAAAVSATSKAMSERIAPLEEARYEQRGGKEVQTEKRDQSRWTTQQLIIAIGAAAAVMDFLVRQGILH